MRRLLAVELTRLRWRRAVLLLLLACFVIPALVWGGLAWTTRPVTEAERAAASAQAAEDRDTPGMRRQYERCLDHPRRYGVGGGDTAAGCDRAVLPQVEWYVDRPQLRLREELANTGTAVLTVVAVLLVLAGTTFVGHDWNSRSMSNQLLFEPRRLRVWSAKAAVVVGVALAVAAVVVTAYWASLWMLAGSRDIATPDRVWDLVQGRAVRGTILVGAGALGAYALTMLFRSTVATLGLLFALTVVSPILLATVGFAGSERWMLHTNVAAVLSDGIRYYDYTAPNGTARLSLAGGAAYLGGLLLLAIVPSLWSFATRDVP